MAYAGTAQGNGLACLAEQVESEFANPHRAADQTAGRIVRRYPQHAAEVIAKRFGKCLLANDDVHAIAAPVQVNFLRVIAQTLEKQGITAQDDLLEQSTRLADNGAGHVFAHADIGDTDDIRVECHPHGQAVDQQRVIAMDSIRKPLIF